MNTQNKTTASTYDAKRAWGVLLVGLMIVAMYAIGDYQIPPIMLELCDVFGMSFTQAGWAQSVVAIAALVLAIPAGAFIMRFGSRFTALVVCAFALVGAIVVLCASSFEAFLVGRAFQGIGAGLGTVLAPQIAAKFFPPEKRGLPIALVSATYTLIYFVMMNAALPIEGVLGWRGLWYIYIIVIVAAAALAVIFIPSKDQEPQVEEEGGTGEEKPVTRKAYFTPMAWIPALVFVLFNIGYFAISMYMPTYLVDGAGANPAQANLAVSLNAIAGFPAAIVAGIILGKMKISHRKYLPAAVLVVLGVCYFFSFSVQSVFVAALLLILFGFMACVVPPSLNTIAADILPAAPAAAISIVIFGQNVGGSLGPIVSGAIIDAAGWTMLSVSMAICALVAAALCLAIKVKADSSNKAEPHQD